jgi:hypothetical protein
MKFSFIFLSSSLVFSSLYICVFFLWWIHFKAVIDINYMLLPCCNTNMPDNHCYGQQEAVTWEVKRKVEIKKHSHQNCLQQWNQFSSQLVPALNLQNSLSAKRIAYMEVNSQNSQHGLSTWSMSTHRMADHQRSKVQCSTYPRGLNIVP